MNSLTISSDERQQYQQHFLNANPIDGKLPGSIARANLLQSGLTSQQLGDIWELADIDKDGALDFDEYCIALKLVFSLLHHVIPAIPPVLPPGLIPETKYKYFGAGMVSPGVQGSAVSIGSPAALSDAGALSAGQRQTTGGATTTTLEWYVPGEDRVRYEGMFSQYARGSAQVRLLDVDEFLNSLGISRPTVTQAWALVDVRKYQQLNKDQFVYLLHVLNAYTKGARIPVTLPSAVKDNIYRSLNLDIGLGGGGSTDGMGSGSHSYRYGKSSVSSASLTSASGSRSNKPGLYGEKSGNVALADSYLSKLKSSSTFKNEPGSRYASSSKNSEEEKRLRAELDDLESELRSIKREEDEQEGDSGDSERLEATFKELERLRDQKKTEKRQIEEQICNGKPAEPETLQDIKQSIYKLEGHLSFLLSEKRAMDSFISSSKQELLDLQMEQIKLK
ncbi:endocytosis defective- protein [Coemansia sp. RSA 1813]|nr:endocytosis defective- protein [Coemansia sp. RSA 1646]KAJ1769796.1 endocytosis defective- protein [Coemansia sp. RSA 1843]KAJ2091272.1 endocytosis defective- protein [Coemansia sp. RSA 986]KAJ2216461.1 endocytosis defective- protein [Coemansia sp. RSA 487]KAJ2571455.1 endocytosis defective- protein [Coemansia sp. RSA 1813]